MKVLVTGGAGFIGSTLVDRLLAEGHGVDVVDDLSAGTLANLAEARADPALDFRFHRLDVRRPELVDVMGRRSPDVVFHLAAPAGGRAALADPRADADQHIFGGLNVLQAAVTAGVAKVVFTSSGAALYGDVEPDELPIRETHPQHPISPTGVANRAVGGYLEVYRALHDLEFTALALGHVYGPRQDPSSGDGVVASFASRMLAGEACTIYGDGRQTRDFVYVDDVVDALVRAAGRGGGLLLNVGTGRATSIRELWTLLAARTGSDRPAAFAPGRAGDVAHSALDPSRAAIHLGWKPWTALEDGLTSVVGYLNRSSS